MAWLFKNERPNAYLRQ